MAHELIPCEAYAEFGRIEGSQNTRPLPVEGTETEEIATLTEWLSAMAAELVRQRRGAKVTSGYFQIIGNVLPIARVADTD